MTEDIEEKVKAALARGVSRQRIHQIRYPDKRRAREAVHRKLEPPYDSKCSKCGKIGKLQAHHNDYSKPLEVEWLCTKCHGERGRTVSICIVCGEAVKSKSDGRKKLRLCGKHYRIFLIHGDPFYKKIPTPLYCISCGKQTKSRTRGRCGTCAYREDPIVREQNKAWEKKRPKRNRKFQKIFK